MQLRYLYTLPFLLSLLLPVGTHAHELDGIEHVHLANGVVQIVDSVPGATSVPTKPAEKESSPPAKSTQPSGFASLLIQLVLIASALVLFFVALNAGTRHRKPPLSDP